MNIKEEIQNMYKEIILYEGDFGDPIVDTFSFDPMSVLTDNRSEDSEKLGASVALLVMF